MFVFYSVSPYFEYVEDFELEHVRFVGQSLVEFSIVASRLAQSRREPSFGELQPAVPTVFRLYFWHLRLVPAKYTPLPISDYAPATESMGAGRTEVNKVSVGNALS